MLFLVLVKKRGFLSLLVEPQFLFWNEDLTKDLANKVSTDTYGVMFFPFKYQATD